ncbi:MAG: XdhC family protein [Eubacterium sp.]|nr:XdhC family protein [Eubacterium sp.]
MDKWYENVKDGAIVLTCVSGENTGERAVIYEKNIIWKSSDSSWINLGCEKINDNVTASFEIGNNRIVAEKLTGHNKLVICGCGHVGIAILKLAKMLGFYVLAVDERKEFSKVAKTEGADEAFCREYPEMLREISSDLNTYFVIVTRGHSKDRECLNEILRKPHAYVGMMGSKSRFKAMKKELVDKGIDKEIAENIHAPIGLNIKSETPEEIAVSVIAEIISVKNRGDKGQDAEDIITALKIADKRKVSCVLASIISKEGSAPRKEGTKMVIFSDEKPVGTIGGGYIEEQVIKTANEMLEKSNEKNKLIKLSTASEGDDVGCGGRVEVFLDMMYN